MGKAQKKTGKGRLDKYYKLAKCVELLTSSPGVLIQSSTENRVTVPDLRSSLFS